MSAVTKRRAEVSCVSRKDFSALMLAEPKLALEALRVLAAEVQIARAAIVQCPQSFSHDSSFIRGAVRTSNGAGQLGSVQTFRVVPVPSP